MEDRRRGPSGLQRRHDARLVYSTVGNGNGNGAAEPARESAAHRETSIDASQARSVGGAAPATNGESGVADAEPRLAEELAGRALAVAQHEPLGGARVQSTVVDPRVSVVIPALNEAENLPHVFGQLPDDIYEVVVVDGHSTDGTVQVARSLDPDVRIVTQTRRGKGNALACGFEACSGDIIVMLDADGSANAGEIARFVNALQSGADFAKGSRFLPGGGSADITRLRRAGNWFFSALVNVLFGTRYSDLCYGYNAFWAHCLPHIDVNCDGFEVETLINIRVAKAGLTVAEVPSYEEERIHGSSNLRTFRDGFRVLATILRERLRRRPSGVPEYALATANDP